MNLEFFKVGFVYFLAWSFSRKLGPHDGMGLSGEFKRFMPYAVIFLGAMFIIAFLQKDLGHNPKEQKLESVANCVKQFKKITQTNNIIETIRNSFLLADHFINNSKDNLTKLKKVLKKNHQETFELVSKINKISKKYNLLIIEENKTFSKHILEYFSKSVSGKLNWRVLDPIDHFRKSVIKASTQDTNDT